MSWFDYRMFEQDYRELAFGRAWLVAYTRWKINTGVHIEFDKAGNEHQVPPPYSSAQEMLADPEFWPKIQNLCKFADKIEIPYDYFWRYAFEVITIDPAEYGPDIKSFMSVGMKNIISEMWNSESEVHLVLSDDDFFNVKNYYGHPVQLQYIGYLVSEVRKRHPQNTRPYLDDFVARGQLKKEWLDGN